MMVGTSFIQQQQDEPGMRNQTQNWSWQNIWRGIGSQRPHGSRRGANDREPPSASHFLVSSGLFSEDSSFHPVITQVLTKKTRAGKWGFLCLVLQTVGIFMGRGFFLGKYFYGVFLTWVAQKARGGGDFVLKEAGDSKNGTGKGQMRGR